MNRLELKHIAPYLPYGLKVKWNKSKPFELKGLQKGNDSVNNELFIWQDDDSYNTGYLYECKPILRPLSDLTKEIEHNGEKFVPNTNMIFEDAKQEKYFNDMALTGIFDHTMPYHIVNKMLKCHFDVFGLIEKGLAIDINTLG